MNSENRSYFLLTIAWIMVALLIVGGITVFIDPFFHFHKPFDKISYIISNERYQNDGISRNYEYSGIIIGNSNTEDFKPSECGELLGGTVVKLPYSGAYNKEINEALVRCFERKAGIAYVIRGIDTRSNLMMDKDLAAYDSYPDYLYNNNLLDDVYYFWNKEVLLNYTFRNVLMTLWGVPTTTLDEYANSTEKGNYQFGKEAVLNSYVRAGDKTKDSKLTEEEKKLIEENLEQNVISTIVANPNTTFYLFFPPYSICMWDQIDRSISIGKEIEIQRLAIEKLIPYDNVKLFSFFENYEMITNLDNYRDKVHYSGDVSSSILEWMAQGQYRMTSTNYEEYLNNIYNFYSSYDYDAIMQR